MRAERKAPVLFICSSMIHPNPQLGANLHRKGGERAEEGNVIEKKIAGKKAKEVYTRHRPIVEAWPRSHPFPQETPGRNQTL
jgi:hypothetical protein